MANPEHLDLLQHGIDTWNTWRKEHQDTQPDLSYADLHGADLSYADLELADFVSANLRYADLSWAILYGADFEGADDRDIESH